MIHLANGYEAYCEPDDHEITIYRRDVLGLTRIDRIGTGIEFDEAKGWIDVEPTFGLLNYYYEL